MSTMKVTYRDLPIFSLAAQQNAYKLFQDLRLVYSEPEEGADAQTLRDLSVTLRADGDFILPEVWEISQVAPGQSISLQERPIQLAHEFLVGLTDETSLRFELTVTLGGGGDDVLASQSDTLTILPANFWGGEERQPELLAAFVKPNGIYVESLVRQVTEVLEANGHGRAADGYQSNTRERPVHDGGSAVGCAHSTTHLLRLPATRVRAAGPASEVGVRYQ